MRVVAIVPAAGLASRLGSPVVPKELLLIPGPNAGLEPVIFDALRRCHQAGIQEVVVVSRPGKALLNVFVDEHLESAWPALNVTRVTQSGSGLLGAVKTAVDVVKGDIYVLVLPDTVVRPITCLKPVVRRVRQGAALAFGVFPTKNPREQAPVELDGKGKVVKLQEKPRRPLANNTWGVLAFDGRLCLLLDKETAFCDVLSAALTKGLDVQGVFFGEGQYIDTGTMDGLASVFVRPDSRGSCSC